MNQQPTVPVTGTAKQIVCPHCRRRLPFLEPKTPCVTYCPFCFEPSFAGPRLRWIETLYPHAKGVIDLDNDRRFRRPRAWFKLKELFGGWWHMKLMMMVAELHMREPVVALAVGLHHYLSSDRPARAAMLTAYHDWCDELKKASGGLG